MSIRWSTQVRKSTTPWAARTASIQYQSISTSWPVAPSTPSTEGARRQRSAPPNSHGAPRRTSWRTLEVSDADAPAQGSAVTVRDPDRGWAPGGARPGCDGAWVADRWGRVHEASASQVHGLSAAG